MKYKRLIEKLKTVDSETVLVYLTKWLCYVFLGSFLFLIYSCATDVEPVYEVPDERKAEYEAFVKECNYYSDMIDSSCFCKRKGLNLFGEHVGYKTMWNSEVTYF
jgi:hypothetical protein